MRIESLNKVIPGKYEIKADGTKVYIYHYRDGLGRKVDNRGITSQEYKSLLVIIGRLLKVSGGDAWVKSLAIDVGATLVEFKEQYDLQNTLAVSFYNDMVSMRFLTPEWTLLMAEDLFSLWVLVLRSRVRGEIDEDTLNLYTDPEDIEVSGRGIDDITLDSEQDSGDENITLTSSEMTYLSQYLDRVLQ